MKHEQILHALQKIVAHNEKQMQLAEGDQCAAKDLYTFEFEGMAVYNPLYDTTYRFEVDLIAYYGEEVICRFVEMYQNQFNWTKVGEG